MSTKSYVATLDEILERIEVPDSTYERAMRRYQLVGEWLMSPKAKSSAHDPQITPQGSFRIGTVIKPIDPKEPFDLDMGCRLRKGITKETHTQVGLKALVGADLESYRQAQGIQYKLEEKNRCWRLRYADELQFHMDVVPSIPVATSVQKALQLVLESKRSTQATAVSALSGSITDKRLPQYTTISPAWLISNTEGFALWFESQMSLASGHIKGLFAGLARIDDLPRWKWKTPLQRVVQLLKRHRDVMFLKDKDRQPISAIITTLAGLAYRGEETVGAAMDSVLRNMDSYVLAQAPRVANPANPVHEDFAEKWGTPEGQRLKLEQAFREWLADARAFFSGLGDLDNADALADAVSTRMQITLDRASLAKRIGPPAGGIAAAEPRSPADPRGGGRFG